MADTTPPTRWAVRRVPPPERAVTELIGAGTLDAELAATLWVLLEGRVPIVVAASDPGAGAATLLAALLDFVPPQVQRIELAGDTETFDWLPQASELGWDRSSAPAVGRALASSTAMPALASSTAMPALASSTAMPALPPSGQPAIRPETALLVAPALSDELPSDTWGEGARIAVRAATIGYGLAATIRADSLEEVLAALAAAPVGLSDDERSRLGVVLVLRRVGPGGAPRVVAAHYIRPVARDEHGHVQRLGPAVLATWDAVHDRFEHFGWGITPELALRVGRRAGDFELEVDRRRDALARLVADGVVEIDAVRAAIDHARRDPDPTTVPS